MVTRTWWGMLAVLALCVGTAWLTSLAGLTPLVLVSGSGSELYRGVGAIVLGGLALSTVLTLYVVPSLLSILWRDVTKGPVVGSPTAR